MCAKFTVVDEESVSVASEEVKASDWKKKVFFPEIKTNPKNL